MDVCKWLEEVKKMDQLIDAKIEEQTRLRVLAYNVSPKVMDGMPYSNTGTVSRQVENSAVKLVMLANEINRMIDNYIDYKQEVVNALEKLPEKEYGVLHRYYIRYMTWEKIAEEMGYSTTQIWRIKKNGLKILEDVIECNAEM